MLLQIRNRGILMGLISYCCSSAEPRSCSRREVCTSTGTGGLTLTLLMVFSDALMLWSPINPEEAFKPNSASGVCPSPYYIIATQEPASRPTNNPLGLLIVALPPIVIAIPDSPGREVPVLGWSCSPVESLAGTITYPSQPESFFSLTGSLNKIKGEAII
jgi:hypothetical protein